MEKRDKFENEKYEYLLHTWGGFYNKEHVKKHGLKSGYFWFDSMVALHETLSILKGIEKDLGAYSLASSIYEGKHVRYKTIAKMKLNYKGVAYDYEHDFGYAYEEDAARYMFFDGNYSCDCNKSLFLKRKHGIEIPEPELCGNEIEITEFEILQIK